MLSEVSFWVSLGLPGPSHGTDHAYDSVFGKQRSADFYGTMIAIGLPIRRTLGSCRLIDTWPTNASPPFHPTRPLNSHLEFFSPKNVVHVYILPPLSLSC